MLKITFIGAGSLVFGQEVLTDILMHPALRENLVICLEDIDPHRLDLMYRYLKRYIESNPEELGNVSLEHTTDQRKSITGAKYIISAIQVGGLEATKIDLDIPYKYGVSQCVGDTIGPGGVFRFLRTAPVFRTILKDIEEVGHNAGKDGRKPLFLNYTNPMAMNTWFCNELLPDSTVGLCHGVTHTEMVLRGIIKARRREFSYLCAGINHMAWFLEIWYRDSNDPNATWRDAYPLVHERIKKNPKLQSTEKVRKDMMNATGYFMTESSGHLSEYLPYYRKRKDLLEKYAGDGVLFDKLEHAFYLDLSNSMYEGMDRKFEKLIKRQKLKLKQKHSGEYASNIINAMETGQAFRFNGNVMNKEGGIITNLLNECCVEVPVFADDHGLHPQGGIVLPTVCQALCTSNIMVQKAAVEGALENDREKIYHAVLLDPNTASICSPEEIRDMVDELFKAETKWIIGF